MSTDGDSPSPRRVKLVRRRAKATTSKHTPRLVRAAKRRLAERAQQLAGTASVPRPRLKRVRLVRRPSPTRAPRLPAEDPELLFETEYDPPTPQDHQGLKRLASLAAAVVVPHVARRVLAAGSQRLSRRLFEAEPDPPNAGFVDAQKRALRRVVYGTIMDEVQRFVAGATVTEEIQRVMSGLTLEIKTEVNLGAKKDGSGPGMTHNIRIKRRTD